MGNRTCKEYWYDFLQKVTFFDFENDTSKLLLWKHINGVIRHDAHHAGQMILIRKLQGIWPIDKYPTDSTDT
ncbi:hypothetical protein ACFFF5_06735 [Lederbergia wuyishanensis]|uniref:DinB family protein n=1 Tax=Lederbergia wuyishanensis TaxID=1347903 RepID=A0ABU0D2N7_9BACI|nr:hypothetical protein [Lederbergia wuyishanensis]MCJ8007187.1 hypothetical protein [Lederbergia wuyishanensis]MDQ0342668.1 hypothetical protein [Lederbergia wuyishanensis]